MKVAPSILSADFSRLGQDVTDIVEWGADYIHIDMMDGDFVPNISFGPMVMASIRPLTQAIFDCHMMISEPERYIPAVAEAGADIITIHVEATQHIHKAIQLIKSLDKKAGITLNPGTTIEAIKPVLSMVDLVLVMSVNPGFGGQTFIEGALDRIKELDNIRRQENYQYEIEVDGGINAETGLACKEAGADILVAGSYIFKNEDPKQAIQSLK